MARYLAAPAITAWGDQAQTSGATIRGAVSGDNIAGVAQRQGFKDLDFRMVKRAELP